MCFLNGNKKILFVFFNSGCIGKIDVNVIIIVVINEKLIFVGICFNYLLYLKINVFSKISKKIMKWLLNINLL